MKIKKTTINGLLILEVPNRYKLCGLNLPKNLIVDCVFIDNGCTDDTLKYMLEAQSSSLLKVKIVRLSRNFGYQNGYLSGLTCIPADSQAVVLIDGDVQDPPELILDFIDKWQSGYDVVYGVRTNRNESLIKNLSYKIYYKLLKAFSEFDLPADAGEFSLMDSKIIRLINKSSEQGVLIRSFRAWVGFTQIGVSYERMSRESGSSKFSPFKLINLAIDSFFASSIMPLKFIFFAASFFSQLVCWGLYILFSGGYLSTTQYQGMHQPT